MLHHYHLCVYISVFNYNMCLISLFLLLNCVFLEGREWVFLILELLALRAGPGMEVMLNAC